MTGLAARSLPSPETNDSMQTMSVESSHTFSSASMGCFKWYSTPRNITISKYPIFAGERRQTSSMRYSACDPSKSRATRKREHGMLQMVQHAEEHHNIEVSDLRGREAANVVDAVFGLRSQQIARDTEALEGRIPHRRRL